MIEVTEEMIEYLAIFNSNGTEFKNLALRKDGTENPNGDGEFAAITNLDAGAMGSALEYERRLARFMVSQLRIDKAQNFYLNDYAQGNLNIERPSGFTDEQYRDFIIKLILGLKETPYAIEFILQEFSSIPVVVFQNGGSTTTAFYGVTYYGFYDVGVERDDGFIIPPALNNGSVTEGDGIYLYRVHLQPIDEVAEQIILILLDAATVAGVRYEITYESTPPWH